MGTFDNIKTKILKTPTARDITPRELQSFLDHYGFTLKRSKGSHFMYEYPGEVRNIMLNIPMHNPVKPAYIDKIREI
ncbi:MAG: type II toxin-antitoxin system HicA family toxin, partial [Clostridia bacterium]|nr:type II toxin-antitoxin system HicA family toxin [Clostridia bacterium]